MPGGSLVRCSQRAVRARSVCRAGWRCGRVLAWTATVVGVKLPQALPLDRSAVCLSMALSTDHTPFETRR